MKKLSFMAFVLIQSLFTSAYAFEDLTLDQELQRRIEHFRITPYNPVVREDSAAWTARANLGRFLYMDARIAGNKNMNCMICHHQMLGTSDRRPLSQTQDRGGILKRNSSALFNLGDENNHFMFWDGRVHLNPKTKVFTTPEPAFNGSNPKAAHITKVLTSAASMQALFPMVNAQEMMGNKGENEIADAPNNLEAWDRIVKRLINPANKDYQEVVNTFKMAYPGLEEKDINIGHVGEALYTFMKVQFMSNQSPFHKYLEGDVNALNEQEKRGFEVFTGKGRCIGCHQGNTLSNNTFFASVGVPSYGAAPFVMDRGRGEVAGKAQDFKFRTPSLINIDLTTPYMHNGVFKTLREVIDHYSDVKTSLFNFEVTPYMEVDYPVVIEARNAPFEIDAIWNSVQARFLRNGLNFTEQEKQDLEAFLKNGLTDPRWRPARR